MHTTYSVHAGILKPWRGRLPWPLAVFSFCHVLSLSLFGLNWRSLFPPWGSGPPFPKMAPPFTGSAHTPLSGSGTILYCMYALIEPEEFGVFFLVLGLQLGIIYCDSDHILICGVLEVQESNLVKPLCCWLTSQNSKVKDTPLTTEGQSPRLHYYQISLYIYYSICVWNLFGKASP